MQSILYRFEGVSVIEDRYKLVLLYVLLVGIVFAFFRGFFKKKFLGVRGRTKLVYEFFTSIWFISYVAPVARSIGLKVRQNRFKTVDEGWNESVIGGVGLFELLLRVRVNLLK